MSDLDIWAALRFCTTVWMGMMLVSSPTRSHEAGGETLSLCQLHTNTNQHTSLNTPSSSDCRLWTCVTQNLAQSQSLIPLPTTIGPGKAHDPTWANKIASLGFSDLDGPGSSSFLLDPQTVGGVSLKVPAVCIQNRHSGREKRLRTSSSGHLQGQSTLAGSGSAMWKLVAPQALRVFESVILITLDYTSALVTKRSDSNRVKVHIIIISDQILNKNNFLLSGFIG